MITAGKKRANPLNKGKTHEEVLITNYIIKVFPFTKIIFSRFPWIYQFINFSIVGVINFILSYLIYAALVYINVHYQIANQVSFWLTVLNGFFLNRFWVFKRQASKKSPAQTVKYFATYGLNWVLGIVLLYLYVDLLHINKYIATFISMPITIPLNYALNRYWVFRKK